MIENGNEVVIVTSNVYKMAEYERMDRIPVYRFPCWNLLDGRYPVIKPNRRFWKIYKVLKQQNFDMVIVNTRFYLHSLCGMILAKSKHIPCITLDHGTSHLSVHIKFWDFVGEIFEHGFTKIGRLFCKDYYGVSAACNEWLRHFHIKAKGVLYNSIDFDEIQKMRAEISVSYRKKYYIPDDAVVISFTGRLLEEKGLPSLLNVMDRIHKENERIYLFIAGDGDMEAEIGKRSSDYIIPLGRIDFEHIVALLEETDIFCLPSFSEGFSTSILEAAACDCYILTTARGGAKELLISEQYGCIIPNNDEEILYRALKGLFHDEARRKKGVELTGKRVRECFTWDIVADQVEKICKEKTS